MKFSRALLAFTAACLLILSACSPDMEELSESPPTPNLKGKTILNTQDYYSMITESSPSVYLMHVTRYTDGTADISRSTVPYNSSFDYAGFVVDGVGSAQQSGSGIELGFSSGGYFVPFDPGQPAMAIYGGGYVRFDCVCYGSGGCGVSDIFTYPNGGIKFNCKSFGCDEMCIRSVGSIVGNDQGGLFIQSTNVQIL